MVVAEVLLLENPCNARDVAWNNPLARGRAEDLRDPLVSWILELPEAEPIIQLSHHMRKEVEFDAIAGVAAGRHG